MLASLTDLKAALGITDNTQDATLTRSLMLANGLIAGYIGVDLSDTTTPRTFTSVVDSGSIKLPLFPVVSVDSLTANGVAVPEEANSGWWLDKRLGMISDYPHYAHGNGRYGSRVTVVYRSGYNPVPDDLKTACIGVATSIYENGGTIPSGATAGSGELKSLTMFDAMSMSFDTGTTGAKATGAEGMLEAWLFILKEYKINPVAWA